MRPFAAGGCSRHRARGATLTTVPDDADTDEAWAVVRAAAIDLNWDDAREAGISAHPGDVERVALELSATNGSSSRGCWAKI